MQKRQALVDCSVTTSLRAYIRWPLLSQQLAAAADLTHVSESPDAAHLAVQRCILDRCLGDKPTLPGIRQWSRRMELS